MISQVRTALTRKEHLCLWCPVESKQLDSHCSLWLIFSNFSHLKVRCWNQNAFSGLPLQLKMERCAPPAGQLDGTALGHYHRRRWLQLVMFFSTEHRGSLDESLDLRHRCWMCLLESECWELVLQAYLDICSSVLKQLIGLVALIDHRIFPAENISMFFVGDWPEGRLLCHHLRSSVWVCFQPTAWDGPRSAFKCCGMTF